MSNYGSIDTKKIQKFICNTSKDIVPYFSSVASEEHLLSFPLELFIHHI